MFGGNPILTGGGCTSFLGGLEIGSGDVDVFTAAQVTGTAEPD